MDRKAIFAALLPALLLYACDRTVEPAEATVAVASAANQVGNAVPG